MDHAITIGDIVWWSAGALVVGAIIAGLLWFLAAFGRGMSR